MTGGLIRVWLWRASPELNRRRGEGGSNHYSSHHNCSQTVEMYQPGMSSSIADWYSSQLGYFCSSQNSTDQIKENIEAVKYCPVFCSVAKIVPSADWISPSLNLFILLIHVDGSKSLKSPNIWPVCLMNSGYDAVQTCCGAFRPWSPWWQRRLYQCITCCLSSPLTRVNVSIQLLISRVPRAWEPRDYVDKLNILLLTTQL